MMSTPEVEPSTQQPAYLDAPQAGAVIRPLPAGVAATDAANPYAMLPLCQTCGQRVPHGSATHNGERWHCLRCWGAWLAGAPEPSEPTRSQKLAAAGFLRRPSPYSLPSDGE